MNKSAFFNYNKNGDIMKVAYIKALGDSTSFKIFKNLGFNVYEVDNLEDVDKKIEELVNEKNTSIIITNEVASFSQNIIKKYNKQEYPKIIIMPSKNV